MHHMIVEIITGNGLECSRAHVEHDFGVSHALRGESRQQLVREMQSRGGRGDGTALQLIGVHRLVLDAIDVVVDLELRVFTRAEDVGGKRCVS